MAQVETLRRAEAGRLDGAAIRVLEASLGRERSREVLAQVCCEMIGRLRRLEQAVAGGDEATARRLARGLAGICAEVGLAEMSRAALNLHQCLGGADGVAQAATHARLLRLADPSLEILLRLAEPAEL